MSSSTEGTTRSRGRRLLMRLLAGLLGVALSVALVFGVVFFLRPLATLELMGRWALRGAGLEQATVQGPRGPLVYWRGGSGSVVVLLHGANDQSGSWARVAAPLRQRHRLLVPDLPGHGRSAPAEGPLGIADIFAGLEALMDAEVPSGERATLVGNSMGGWLAMLYADRHPDRVSAIVLVNGAALRGDGSEAHVNLLPKNRDEARAAMLAVTSPTTPLAPEFVLDDLVRRAPTSPLARLMASPVEGWLLDGKLDEIRVPVTLLWGEDDKVLPPRYARRVASQLASARLETIAHCGHVPQRECPDRLLPLLEQALGDRELVR
jgi:pimeloyl-ACP methyl ester carboxylesterase